MILYCAMQQHLVFSPHLLFPSPGLYCAIHIPFSELAGMGE